MPVTGATFNFNKTVTEEGTSSTPDKPTDDAKINTKIAGEKNSLQSKKDFVNLSIVQQTIKTAINNTIQNVEGATLSQQASALQATATTVVSSVFMAATNPYALITSLACKGISYGFQVAKFNRGKARERFDLEEYKSARGYSASTNRSRNS